MNTTTYVIVIIIFILLSIYLSSKKVKNTRTIRVLRFISIIIIIILLFKIFYFYNIKTKHNNLSNKQSRSILDSIEKSLNKDSVKNEIKNLKSSIDIELGKKPELVNNESKSIPDLSTLFKNEPYNIRLYREQKRYDSLQKELKLYKLKLYNDSIETILNNSK